MRSALPLALFAWLVAAAVPPSASAQQGTPPDTAVFVVFDHDQPVAHERAVYVNEGDSILVTSMLRRQFADEKGVRHDFLKSMLLVVDSRDLGLVRYQSGQEFDGHTIKRGIVPGDTSITYYREYDGAGTADRLVQPPGRLFVMDSQMFTLFDVLCRSLASKVFTTRRVQLLALQPDSLATPLATVSVSPDTLRLGRTKVPARRYSLEDPSARFELWADMEGRLVRASHAESGLRVERMPEPAERRATGRSRAGTRRSARP